MKNTFNKYAIANLIYKSVVGFLTDEDKNMLDSWLSKKENKFLYKEIINKYNIQNKILATLNNAHNVNITKIKRDTNR
jgi:hypothetical protein